MRNSISRLFRRFFVPPNIGPIHHATPPKASDFGSVHIVYAYVTGLLLALIEIKYEGLSSNLFKEHMVTMMLFLISKSVYVASLVTFPSNHQTNDHHLLLLDLKVVVCHISGTMASELLLLVLVSPIKWFIINASTIILVLTLSLICNYLLKPLDDVTTQGTAIHNAEEQSDNAVNDETEITSSTP